MRSRKRYIVLNGGLGNQLWQLSFAHSILRFGPVTLVYIQKYDQRESQHTKGIEVLKKVLLNCNHDIQIETRDFSDVLTRAQFIPESKYFIRHKKILDTRNNVGPMYETGDFASNLIFLGYYQDAFFLQNCVETVLGEIIRCINQETIYGSKHEEVESFIHVRGGDYLEARHRSIFGVLNSDYYSDVLRYLGKDLNKNSPVITDDVLHAQKVLSDIATFEILGPNHTNEWNFFRMMANSRLAVIANSTFSWWAGMVVLKRGGRLIAPYPWTIKEKESGMFTSNIFVEGIEKIPSNFSFSNIY
jgi:hypothetical protein